MKKLQASKNEVVEWIRDLGKSTPTYFPQKYGKINFRFDPVEAQSPIQFEEYLPTIVPPGKKLTPAREEIFKFQRNDGQIAYEPILDNSPRILAGVRPCDLKGIYLLDLAYRENIVDPHYTTRRENTAIIAYVCPSKCDDRCFCESTQSLYFEEGADILIEKSGEGFLLCTKTEKGEQLLAGKNFNPAAAGPDKIGRPALSTRSLKAEIKDIPGILKKNWNSPLWDHHVVLNRCFSCGTCNLVCPTCYCFEVKDDLNLDVRTGERLRTWDACMLPDFAVVAGGHNFRPRKSARQRHRVKRKFEYLNERFGQGSFCVGCGRCGRQCTAGIDIYDIVNDLVAMGEQK